MIHSKSFTTSVAIITGHRRGLGRAITECLLLSGWRVLGISRQTLPFDDPIAQHPSLRQVSLDISDTADTRIWISEFDWSGWRADSQQVLLINNAGQVTPVAPAGQTDGGSIERAIALNVTGPLLLSNAFLEFTGGCPDRRLVHISSGAGRSAYAGWGVYCASKAALDHHARCLALENHAGLRVESLAPGVIDTDMQSELRSTAPGQFPMLQRFIDLKQQGGLTSPADAAARIVHHIMSDSFGTQTITDARSFSS